VEQKSLLNTGEPRFDLIPDHDINTLIVYVRDKYTDKRVSEGLFINNMENYLYLTALRDMYNIDYDLYLDQILGYCFNNFEHLQ